MFQSNHGVFVMSLMGHMRKTEILVVDDDPLSRIELLKSLRGARLANGLHTVSSGEEAMSFLQKEDSFAGVPTPDLILFDNKLTAEGDLDYVGRIHADEAFHSIPIFLLDPQPNGDNGGTPQSNGEFPHIEKPLNFTKLCDALSSQQDFWFEIVTPPGRQIEGPLLPSPGANGTSKNGSSSQQTLYRALIVEDSPSDRLLMVSALSESRQTAFELTECDRLESAIAALETTKFDVIVTDLGLPDCEGVDTVRRLVKAAAGTPIVVVTVLDDDEVGAMAMQEGAVDYLVKGEVEGRMLARTLRFAVERSRIEEQMRHAQRMESLGVLAGGIAHDFNNLLMVVRGNAELQQRWKVDNPKVERASNQILKAADRASTLTRQLLAFGRRERIHLSTIGLNATISEFVKLIKRLLGPTIDLRVSLSEEEISVSADPSLLEQVIMNLSVNARDAMPDGGMLEIESSVLFIAPDRAGGVPPAGPGPYASLIVRDRGHGMDPELMARIFEPFFTTKSMGRGTGLGLSTSFGIVRQHRGAIEVNSELGVGTEFNVLIPLASTAEEKQEVETSTLPAGHGERILVVDDEQMVRELAVSFLEMHGYEVKQAESGAEVIRRWDELEDAVDLVVTDLIMPEGVSGRDLGTWLFEHKPELKVIYCSGFSRPHLNRKFKLRENVNFLPKPYSVGQLLGLVSRVLGEPAEN